MSDDSVVTPRPSSLSLALKFKVKDLMWSFFDEAKGFFSIILKGTSLAASSRPRKDPTIPPPEINTDCDIKALSH